MKVAVVSEFLADEAAVKILADSILGEETELVSLSRLRPRGWASVFNMLPSIIKDLHYNSDADGLIVVVDSDESTLHSSNHDSSDGEVTDCRLCKLRSIVTREFSRLSPVLSRGTLNVAIGIAIPAIEAWYRCGLDPHVTEAEWSRKLRGERLTYNKQSLKISAYGPGRISNFARTELAKDAARRLTENLQQLEERFPGGFGNLVRDLRGWITATG